MWSVESKSRVFFVAVVTCVVLVTLGTQWHTDSNGKDALSPAIGEYLATPRENWASCLEQWSEVEPKADSPQSLLTMYPISRDAYISGKSDTVTMRDVSSSQTARSLDFLSRIAQAVQQTSIHKSVVQADTGHLIFADNTVVTADIPTCTIMSVHLPRQNGELHPDMVQPIEGKRMVRKDKGRRRSRRRRRRSRPPPRPRPRPPMAPPGKPKVPCTVRGLNHPPGCQIRIKPWNQIKNHPACRSRVTFVGKHSRRCVNFSNRDRIRSNLCNRKLYCVKFNRGRHGRQTFGIIMQAGESWGKNPINNEIYDCQGRCGGGCGSRLSLCSNWSRGCLRHDVCSWYYGGGRNGRKLWLDPNCGDETTNAFKDWKNCCMSIFCRKRCRGPNSRNARGSRGC